MSKAKHKNDESVDSYSFIEGKDVRARVVKAYLEYAEKNYAGRIDINHVCKIARVDPRRIFELDDWLTAREAFTIANQLEVETNDKEFSRKAGRFAISKNYLGIVPYLALRYLLSTSSTFKNLANLMRQFNRFLRVDVQQKGWIKRQVIFDVSIKDAAKESPIYPVLSENLIRVIENMMGYIEAIPTIKSEKPLRRTSTLVKEQDGRYLIKLDYWEIQQVYITVGLIALAVGSLYAGIQSTSVSTLLSSISIVHVLSALLALSFFSWLSLYRRWRKSMNVVELGGLLGEIKLEKQDSLNTALQVLGSAMPRDLLFLAGIDSLKQITPGQSSLQEMTVSFLDLKGFTRISLELGPEKTVEWLNEFYNRASAITRSHQGAVSKLIGDAMLSFYPKNPKGAIDGSVEILKLAAEMNASLPESTHYHPRIGLSTGPVNICILGNTEYLEVTGIGEYVNLASRLENLNKRLDSQILIAESTVQALDEPQKKQYSGKIRYVGKHLLRGEHGDRKIFDVSHSCTMTLNEVQEFEDAMLNIDLGAFSKAEGPLRLLAQKYPNDLTLKKIIQHNKLNLKKLA